MDAYTPRWHALDRSSRTIVYVIVRIGFGFALGAPRIGGSAIDRCSAGLFVGSVPEIEEGRHLYDKGLAAAMQCKQRKDRDDG